jgi:hypothetical protein
VRSGRDLARLGRFRLTHPGTAGVGQASALYGRAVGDAASIADIPSAHPRAASSRPEVDDLRASAV